MEQPEQTDEGLVDINDCGLPAAPPPVVIWAYTRAASLDRLLRSLYRQTVVPPKVLVYVDAPSGPDDAVDVAASVAVVQTWASKRLLNVAYSLNRTHKGCRKQVLDSVTDVLSQSEYALFLDDDLELSEDCYSVICKLLSLYAPDERIFSVSAFSSPIYSAAIRDEYDGDFIVTNCFETWAWATWRNRWSKVSDALNRGLMAYQSIEEVPLYRHMLSIPLPLILYEHFRDRLRGRRWSYGVIYHCFREKLLVVVPKVSLARNLGTGDPRATNDSRAQVGVNAYYAIGLAPRYAPRKVAMCRQLSESVPPWIRKHFLEETIGCHILESDLRALLGAKRAIPVSRFLSGVVRQEKKSFLLTGPRWMLKALITARLRRRWAKHRSYDV